MSLAKWCDTLPPGCTFSRAEESCQNPGLLVLCEALQGSEKLKREERKQIRRDVERLFKVASELRDEVQRTDSTSVISLHLIDKVGEIEKPAKRIKDLGQG